jgi:hypothetical protein
MAKESARSLLGGQVEGLSGEGKVNVAFVPLGTPLLVLGAADRLGAGQPGQGLLRSRGSSSPCR